MFTEIIRHPRSLLTLGVAALGLSVAVPTAQAEFRQVDQTVFGMDCAPCAYGTERGLSQIAGVTDVKVSLNDAKAVLELAPENEVTLQEIRRVIRNGGFNPRQARVEAVGELKLDEENDQRLLVLESGERFVLRPGLKTDDAERNTQLSQAWQQFQQLEPGQRLVVQGVVPKREAGDERAALTLHVEQAEPVQADEQDDA